jgi:hypothetical protein
MATDPRLFQAPWRAGIQVLADQLEPLRKVLLRVNLFIADHVGLGKTIEAGLIARELMLRQKARRIVVAAPSSVVLQWRDELQSRFEMAAFADTDGDGVQGLGEPSGSAAKTWVPGPLAAVTVHRRPPTTRWAPSTVSPPRWPTPMATPCRA